MPTFKYALNAALYYRDPRYSTVGDAWLMPLCKEWSSIPWPKEDAMLTGNSLIDNDSRWTLVPNDPVQIPAGLTPHSQCYLSDDAEYEDAVDYMRRKSYNIPR